MYKQLRKSLIGRCLAIPVRIHLPKEWWESSKVSQTSSLNPLEKQVTWVTCQSPQLEFEVQPPEHDVLEKVDMPGCTEWDPEDWQEVQNILRECTDVFARNDLDLGQTSIIKYKITLEEGARSIKECYRRVPLGLYDEVWKHLQEMINVRGIWPSNSPWASVVVLVRKKNSKLHFCINLRRLNSLMVKYT